MRLIDADNLFLELKRNDLEFMQQADIMDCIKDIISREPTAYDLDKVMEKLREKSFIPGDRICVSDLKIIMAEKAIEIVKSGGVQDDD